MKNFTYTIVITISLLLISHSSFSQTKATYDITFELGKKVKKLVLE